MVESMYMLVLCQVKKGFLMVKTHFSHFCTYNILAGSEIWGVI